MVKVPKPGPREWDSTGYHRLSSPQLAWGRKVLARLELHGDETVMDAGCGSGKLTAELLERLPRGRVIAVDLSLNMLRSAREHLAAHQPRALVLNADLQDLPLREACDGIFSSAAFHWARDHERMFRSLFAALKPGGWLEAQCGGGPNLARVRQRAGIIMRCQEYEEFFGGWDGPWEFADPETTAERMRRAGFVEVVASLEASPLVFASAAEFCEYLATVTLHQHLARIPDQHLRQRFLREMARHAEQDDPPYQMDYWRVNMSGRRQPE